MRPRWLRAALCHRFSHLPWIADSGQVTSAKVESMRTVCDACPVLLECEEHAGSELISSGFWAGQFRTTQPIHPARRAR